MCRRNKSLVKELSTPPPRAKDLYFPTQYSQSLWGQFKSCLWKQWWTYWRSPDYNLVRYFFTLACALMLGTIFWKVGTKRFVSTSYIKTNSIFFTKSDMKEYFIILIFTIAFPSSGIARLTWPWSSALCMLLCCLWESTTARQCSQ